MKKRLELQQLLEKTLGSRNVYFQPPSNIKMSYPAIVYSRDNISNRSANNGIYKQSYIYQITVIDSNPDSKVVERISKIPTARFERHFKSDNLNHDIFTIFY